jgi:hypothetical protein
MIKITMHGAGFSFEQEVPREQVGRIIDFFLTDPDVQIVAPEPVPETVAAPKATKKRTISSEEKSAFVAGLAKHAAKTKGCPECGSPLRHKKDCSRKPQVPSVDPVRDNRPSLARFDLDDEPEERFGLDDEDE